MPGMEGSARGFRPRIPAGAVRRDGEDGADRWGQLVSRGRVTRAALRWRERGPLRCGRPWAEERSASWAAVLARRGCGMGLGRWLAGPSARKRRRRWAAGKRREWVGPEGFPGWATRLIWFFLFSFLLPFSNQLKSN